MVLKLKAMTEAVTLLAGCASAFNPADLQKLKETGTCEKCHLIGAIVGVLL